MKLIFAMMFYSVWVLVIYAWWLKSTDDYKQSGGEQ
jgi:hypothetical protein